MWVGGVEIPADLVDAHRSGNLVLFVGAGASRDAPSGLPDFRQLTETIANEAQYAVAGDELLHPDVVLGRIKDRGVDVHLRVAENLNSPHSTHNDLHQAIIDLSLASPDPRVVTTNFDRHLTSAIEARGHGVEEYTAPALPVGDDFAGLVHLHGSLEQPPARLVVTDADFGRAYLRDAWATRFLERMFAKFSVLFIGYSHGDVVMRYLARALGPDGHRYVLTDTPHVRDWQDLGLRPIGYEVVDSSHAALGNAIGRWAEIASMGLLDHRQCIADLVASAPSGIPEDESYLEEVVADPERVRLFVEFARAPEWLDWISTQPVFRDLLSLGSQPSDVGSVLAEWFIEHFVMEEAHTERALGLVEAGGGYLTPVLCDQLGAGLHRLGVPRPPWLGIWLALLVRDAPASAIHWLDYALGASTWPTDRESALLLFDHLTEPTASLAPSYGLGAPRIEVHLAGGDYWLRQFWDQILKPNLLDVAHVILAMADRHLRRARDIQATARPGSAEWDAVSFGRSAIEPHPQDRYTEPIDVLIDAARDALRALLDSSDPAAAGYLRSWAEADSQILQRLAIHGWTYRSDIDSSAKLRWVANSGRLFNHAVHHEVFHLLAEALPDASDDAIELLVDAALRAEEGESEHRPYERFNLLVWMDRARPNHPRITAALARAHAVDPNWRPRRDPDLTHSMESGFVLSRPPMSVVDFHTQARANPSALLSTLQATRESSHWDGEPTWEDAVSLIVSAIQDDPSDGFRLLDVEPTDVDVERAVIGGWSRAELDAHFAAEVIARIVTLDRRALVRDLVRLLSDGGQSEGYPTNWTAVPGARQLACELWPLIPIEDDDGFVSGDIDWLTRAINHPGGQLAEFWLHAVQSDWRSDDDAWPGLSEEHRDALETMLGGPSDESRTHMVEVICASRLHFLFAADQGWTIENVMPLLDWTDRSRARRAWSSFARWGRWNDRMLDAGLMQHYLEAVCHLGEFDDADRPPILGHLAGIALISQQVPLVWLPRVIVALSDQERVEFADALTTILDDLPVEAVEHQWNRWMREYWDERLASIPTQLSFDEATAMAGWIPALSKSFESGAQLVLSRPSRFREHDSLLRRIARHVDDSPAACTRIIGHLMQSTEPPWWGGHQLPELMPRLVAGSDPTHISVIVEEALRLGMREIEG